MPRVTWVQNNFNAGEWSPLTYGRSDVAKYKNALATCLNYVPTAQGGLTRRPGTKYIAGVKNSANAVRLLPFEFSITQAYVLEFGPNYLRFYTDAGAGEGQLLVGNPTAWSTTTPYAVGDLVVSGFVAYYCIVAHTSGVFATDLAAGKWYSLASGVYEIPTPYGASDLQDLSVVQSADVLYIAHPNYAPRKLQRKGALKWLLSTITFKDGPYLNTNTETTTMDWSAMTGTVTVTLSSTVGVNGNAGFSANDVGRVIRYKPNTKWGYATITGYTSVTQVTAVVSVSPDGAHAATTNWRLGVWYGVEGSSTTANYPRCVVFNQDRLIFAGSAQYPNRLDGSNTSDYENYAPSNVDGTVVDSNALSFSLNAAKVNTINWMVSDEWGLLVGTASAEWVIAASTQQNAVTPTNVTAKMTTSYGGTNVPPVRVGKSTLFVQRTKRKLREMAYQFTLGTFQAPDISMIAEHLTKSGIKQMAAQQAPQPVVWMVRNDGVLVGMSYDKDQEILGWHQHSLGGYSDAAQTTAPVVESVACIPTQDTTRDQVWLAVKRYINGSVVRTVELMTKFWEDGDTLPNAYFVDCGATYYVAGTFTRSGTTMTCTLTSHGYTTGQSKTLSFSDSTFGGFPNGATYTVTVVDANTFTIPVVNSGATSGTFSVMTSTVSGLTWLAGQTVSVLADGSVHPTCVVSGAGAITLQRSASTIQIGLGYNSDGRTMRIEAGGADGTAQGKLKRIHRAIFRFFQSVGLNVQPTNGTLYPENFRTSADLMNNPVALYTGDKRWAWEGSYELEGQVFWRQSDPLPSNVLQVVAQLETQDGG